MLTRIWPNELRWGSVIISYMSLSKLPNGRSVCTGKNVANGIDANMRGVLFRISKFQRKGEILSPKVFKYFVQRKNAKTLVFFREFCYSVMNRFKKNY